MCALLGCVFDLLLSY